MVQTTKTQPSDTLRGVALLDDPIRNKGTAFRCGAPKSLLCEGRNCAFRRITQDSGGTPIV
jgi:hypothetical protein